MTSRILFDLMVGACRLVAIYFVMKTIDAWAAFYSTYQIQIMALSQQDTWIPNAWLMFTPIFVIQFAMILVAWFGAPRLCKYCYPKIQANAEATESEPNAAISANETLIFLAGLWLLGWSVIRVAEDATHWLPAITSNSNKDFSIYAQIRLLSTLALAGVGFVLMSRFAAVHRWTQRRKYQDTYPPLSK